MLAPGRTLRMGLTACGSSAPPSHSATVNFIVNGAYSVNKPAVQNIGRAAQADLFPEVGGAYEYLYRARAVHDFLHNGTVQQELNSVLSSSLR